MDHGTVMRIDVLDRILDGDNVLRFVLVDVVNNSSHRRGLTGTRRTGYKDDTVLSGSHRLECFRKSEFFELRDLSHKEADAAGKIVTLMINICSDSNLVVDHKTEVKIFSCFNTLDLLIGKDRIDHGEGFLGCRTLIKNVKYSVSSDREICAYGNMHVGTILLDSIIH